MVPIAAIVLGAALAATGASAGDSRCGPFGDPAAQERHGFFTDFVSDHNPICIGGVTLGPWTDSGGADRYACLYESAAAIAEKPLPLVVFLHGSLATADSILVTSLKGLIGQSDLGGSRPGFILLAPEGRNTTHYYPGFDSTGIGWDTWYRQFNPAGDVTIAGVTYAENVDAATIDHFVDEEVSSGKVDRQRIYLTGWSNGAAMAILYALNRPAIAAAAVYSAPSPFGAFDDACPQVPRATPPAGITEIEVANPRLPIMHVRNSCDIGGICPNGNVLAVQIRALGGDFVDVVLDSSGQSANCDDSCGTNPMAGGSIGWWNGLKGAAHHAVWPKRSNDAMLDFLKRHPLGVNR
jgi:predicted esterase